MINLLRLRAISLFNHNTLLLEAGLCLDRIITQAITAKIAILILT